MNRQSLLTSESELVYFIAVLKDQEFGEAWSVYRQVGEAAQVFQDITSIRHDSTQ